jgi:hypothetical protein
MIVHNNQCDAKSHRWRTAMSEHVVWVRFTVESDDPREARTRVRRALKSIEFGSGCLEAVVFDRTPTEHELVRDRAATPHDPD